MNVHFLKDLSTRLNLRFKSPPEKTAKEQANELARQGIGNALSTSVLSYPDKEPVIRIEVILGYEPGDWIEMNEEQLDNLIDQLVEHRVTLRRLNSESKKSTEQQ